MASSSQTRYLSAALCAALALAFLGQGASRAGARAVEGYTFERLADNTGPIHEFGTPVISNTGTVAFLALLDSGQQAIFAFVDHDLVLVADEADYPSFNPPSISENGTIAFAAREPNSGSGLAIVSWRRGRLTTVVERADGPFSDLNTVPAFIRRNAVAFWGRLTDGSDVIAMRRIRGGPIKILASPARGVAVSEQSPGANGHGSVVFTANALPQGGPGVFVASPRGVVDLVDSSGPFHVFSSAPSINDVGTVVFHANLDGGEGGIFRASRTGEVHSVVIDGDVLTNAHRPTINNRGEVVFIATIVGRGVNGIFTGLNPDADRIVAVGDIIGGFRVSALSFWRGQNDKGEIVFAASSNDGTQCLFRARPRFEADPILYEIIDLGVLPGTYTSSVARGINELGQVVGASRTDRGEFRASFWNPTSDLFDLGTLGGNFSEALAINDSGQIVGASYVADQGPQRGFIFSDGVMTDLGGIAADDINNAGQVVGMGFGPIGPPAFTFGTNERLDPSDA